MLHHQNINIAVDAIVIAYKEQQLFILLIQQKYGIYKGSWSLPGGFVLDGESLSGAVQRELKEEAGIKVNYLEQLYTFGDDVTRDPRGQVVSVAYFALVNPSKFKLQANTDAQDAQWFPANDLPSLAFDHAKIIDKAIERIKGKLMYQPIGFDLLNKEFAFSDLENLYKTILGKNIDRRNFRKKIMSFEILEETDKIQQIGSGRPAKMYRFKKSKYRQLEKEGFHFEIKFA
ncbi:MAG: NUDIX domain-containing protein [Saprospiraceae bacterium]|nr:NUDIX domain-containing protein [Saprospiraceae bacterium]